MPTLSELMDQFSEEVDSFIASAVFDSETGQGIVNKSVVEDFDPDIPNAYMSEVIKENEKALAALKAGVTTEDYLITTNQIYILMRVLGDTKYFQGCAIGKDGNLGMTRMIMKKYSPLFTEELKKKL
jgi:predicted regulator of Ras-like GTPase activity (Roadblock/LC7/MglB family)